MKLNHWRTLSFVSKRGLRSAPTTKDKKEKGLCADVDHDGSHWELVKNIFVAAFHNYPLFKFVVPDESKRPEFLRRYLDAVMHVSNQDKKSYLLTFSNLIPHSSGYTKSVIGGTLLLRPCFSGGSWKDFSDEDTTKAYEKFNLAEIDAAAVTRLKSYDQWESEYVSEKLKSFGVPTWNATFYGIEPKHIGNGNGSNGFVDGLPLLFELQSELSKSELSNRDHLFHDSTSTENQSSFSKSEMLATPRIQHNNTFMILGISHCPRAANFHRKNGMLHIASLPFLTQRRNSPFDVHILYYDPFESGKVQEIQKSFETYPPRQ